MARNSTLTRLRMTRPSASSASQPASTRSPGAIQSSVTSATCSAAVPPSTRPRREAGSKYATGAASAGTRINASSSMGSVAKLREVGGRNGVELAIDVKDDDAHDEHADEHVEEHADLDEEGQARRPG